jgi:hypothetical protein
MLLKKSKLIPSAWEVPDEFHRRVGDRPGRQRAIFAEDHLLLVLHEPPKPDEATRKGRLFWRKPDASWASTGFGAGVAALERHLEEFIKAIDECDLHEDQATTADEYFQVMEQVAPLKRAAENLHQVLQDARKMLPHDRDMINLRDQAYDISRTVELLYDATKNGLELAQTRRAEEQARIGHAMAESAHRLNLLASFFFPLATLTALFGMQFGIGLEQIDPPWPFVAVLIVGVLAGFVISFFVVRPSRKGNLQPQARRR